MRVKRFITLAAAALALIFTGCFSIIQMTEKLAETNAVTAVEWNDSVGSVYKNLRYADGDFGTYDMYVPEDRTQKNASRLILYIHGGSYTGGDKADGDNWCKYFAAKGYTSVSANYTLNDGKHEASINLMDSELLDCVASAKAHAEETFGIAFEKMAVTGLSAGGGLALLYAWRSAEKSAVPVAFVFEQTGPASFEPALWDVTEDDKAAEFITLMSGHTVTESMVKSGSAAEYWQHISPVCHVAKDSVPCIVAYGPYDKVVPPKIKDRLIVRLSECGATYCYIEYPHSGHAMMDDVDKQEEFFKKVDEYCSLYF